MLQPFSRITISLLPLVALGLGSCSKSVEVKPPQVEKSPDALIAEGITGQHGGTLVLASPHEPRTLNPLVVEDLYSSRIIERVLWKLTYYDWVERKMKPGLAKSWTISEDNQTYTFHLRSGIFWSDGEPITADDVIFTFDCIFDPNIVNRYTDQFTYDGRPVTFRKIDNLTVEFTTPGIIAPFLNDIGNIEIVPQHVFQAARDAGTFSTHYTIGQAGNDPASIVCSGPFKIKSFRSGERIVLERNPYFFKYDSEGKQLPYIDYHIVKFVQDPNTALFLFGTGTINVTGVPPTDLGWLRKNESLYDYRIERQGTRNGITFKWLNLHPGKNEKDTPYVAPHKFKWFSDKRFRQAIQYGYDRQGIIDAILIGRGQPLHSPIPPCKGAWHNPNVRAYRYNPAKSRELLLEMGFRYRDDGMLEDEAGRPVSIELLATQGGGPSGEAMDTAFVENMKDIGIHVELEPVDFGTMIVKTTDSFDYEMAEMGFGGGNDEPSGSKALFMSSGRFHVWYPSQEQPATEWEAQVDQLFQASIGTLDRQKRIEIMHEIQAIYAEELPLMFNIIQDIYYGVSNSIQNLRVPDMGSIIWNIEELWMRQEDNS